MNRKRMIGVLRSAEQKLIYFTMFHEQGRSFPRNHIAMENQKMWPQEVYELRVAIAALEKGNVEQT